MQKFTKQPLAGVDAAPVSEIASKTACAHCGDPCSDGSVALGDLHFCCTGCKAVYQLLRDNHLDSFYDIAGGGGLSLKGRSLSEQFGYLDDELVARRLLDFADGNTSRVTFYVPQMYCSACIWLLENLQRLNPAIMESRVNFPRRRLSVTFRSQDLTLRGLVELLAMLGYTPKLTMGDLDKRSFFQDNRKLILRTGIAGFAFANIMLFSFPDYLATVAALPQEFAAYFGYLSLLLALPVLLYSSADFFRTAVTGLKQRQINLDVPISLGIVALFLRSAYEVLAGVGSGYFDSMSGLVFLLLIGRVVQAKTFQALSFDRDYKSYFPLFVTRLKSGREEQIGVQRLEVGDRILVRSGELVVADAILIGDSAAIDYSFVTGESTPIIRNAGDTIYAGGRVTGAAAQLETVKEVSQSYLVSLWDSEKFARRQNGLATRISLQVADKFTYAVITIAVLTFVYWFSGGIGQAVTNATAVLIVACPCALALAIPFTFGTAMTILGRRHLFLREQAVIEKMSSSDTIVFDKTGTLTDAQAATVRYEGRTLSAGERSALRSVARQSTHPLSRAIESYLADAELIVVRDFHESIGQGVRARVAGKEILIGSASWMNVRGVAVTPDGQSDLSHVHVAIGKETVGRFELLPTFRESATQIVPELRQSHALWLLSGDNPTAAAEALLPLFESHDKMKFRQSPHEKLSFIENLRVSGRKVVMVGDGLNDAGALAAADVGIAVSDEVSAFSPACDGILSATALRDLPRFLKLSRAAARIVIASLVISLLYNLVGLYFAVSGSLSPLIAAILMPVSSISVVGFAVLGTRLTARRLGLN